MSYEVKTYLDEKKTDIERSCSVLMHKGMFSQRTSTASQLDQRVQLFFPSNYGRRQNDLRARINRRMSEVLGGETHHFYLDQNAIIA